MRKLYRVLALSLVLVLALPLALAVNAQDEVPGPGEGGVIIRGNTRGSANLGPLVPIRCSGVDCADVNALLYPGLVALDPETQNIGFDTPGQLATGWTSSEDGLTVTFTMRQDAFWNDGTPITANDVYFVWEAMQHPEEIGLSASYGTTARQLVAAEVIDDYTISFTFGQFSCRAILDAALPVMPAHAYGYVRGEPFDWTVLAGHGQDREPAITAGPFNFLRAEPGTAVYLVNNPNYYEPTNGQYVVPQGFVYLDTPDEAVLVERFLSFAPGEPNFIFEPTANFATLRESDAQFYESPGRVWHYIAINNANPANPQPGLDADGNVIPQDPHPIFGDVRVRQALQHAIDIEEVINGALNGDASPMVSSTIPTAWTIHPTLERRAFDLDAARALLDEAGFPATGAPLVAGGDGLRVASEDAMYAEPGTEMRWDFLTPGGPRNDAAIILQGIWAQLGIAVEVIPLDFNTFYGNHVGAQTYDMAIAGWRGGLPFDPDQRAFFGVEEDIPGDEDGYGFNFTSYYNARAEELFDFILSDPACDPDAIQEAAWELQELFYEEQPYLWMYALNSVYAAAPNVVGFAPYPNFGQWNIDAWYVRTE